MDQRDHQDLEMAGEVENLDRVGEALVVVVLYQEVQEVGVWDLGSSFLAPFPQVETFCPPNLFEYVSAATL